MTFVPDGVTQPDAQTIAEMERVGAIWKEGGMLLAVVSKDKADGPAAVELMNKLRTADGAGSAKAVTGPKGQASLGSPGVSGGSLSNAEAVVAGMAAGFRSH